MPHIDFRTPFFRTHAPSPLPGLDALRLRTRRLTPARVQPGRDFVLCWLMQALRADENPALDAAVALGNAHGLPVVVVHALENRYPYASHRLHRFILEASAELGPGVEARGLRFVRYVRKQGEGEVDLVARLATRAAAVVVDDVPTFVTRDYADALTVRLGDAVAVLGVDACCAVPMNAFPVHLRTTPDFRAAHTPLRDAHVRADTRQTPAAARFDGDVGFASQDIEALDAAGLDALIATCQPTLARTATRPAGSVPEDPAAALRVVFSAGGALREERTLFSGCVDVRTGTWAVDGGRLRLVLDGTPAGAFAYTVAEGRLRLAADPVPCPNTACLRATEADFGVRGGTLTAAEVQTTAVFGRASAGGAARGLARAEPGPSVAVAGVHVSPE